MLDRIATGAISAKHHIQLRQGQALRYEHCFTRGGFDGPYTIMYHERRPHAQLLGPARHGWEGPVGTKPRLAKRHFVTDGLRARPSASQLDGRVPLLFNEDVTAGVVFPVGADPAYSINGDHDELVYIHQGGGVLRTLVGDLPFSQGDYVCVPKGLLVRWLPSDVPQAWFWLELDDLHIPTQWRNPVGQLRMDAPYSHRDFGRPVLMGPIEEGIRELVVRRDKTWHGFLLEHSPLDVVGWDGSVYPWTFPILSFQPRVSSVHLPPTWHGTFAARGALVCSFVPRPVDFHPDAIPCPYPHSSVDCDEIIFYCDGNFTSRRGVGPGSVSLHPMGIPHGPHPGAYERSIGTTLTNELAVMIDVFRPLSTTADAASIEDAAYTDSFRDQ